MVEIELKYGISVSESRRLRKTMNKLAGPPKTWRESTLLFDNKELSFLKTGQTLRIRAFRFPPPAFKEVKSVSLDFKGASDCDNFNSREEISFLIADFREIPETVRLLGFLGNRCVLVYEKEKEEWIFEGVNISIDKLAWLGYFFELEGEKDDIEKVVGLLNLEKKEKITKTTYQLYCDSLKINLQDPQLMSFHFRAYL